MILCSECKILKDEIHFLKRKKRGINKRCRDCNDKKGMSNERRAWNANIDYTDKHKKMKELYPR